VVTFTDTDLETPTEADLDQAYGSRYLSTGDVGEKKIKTKIAKVRKEDLRGQEGKTRTRFVLLFDSLDKALVLNATNKNEITNALGRVPAKWIGATVGLYVDDSVMFAGKRTKGLRLRVISPVTMPKPAAKPVQQAPWEADEDVNQDPNDAIPTFAA
jgi:hypothetical protein